METNPFPFIRRHKWWSGLVTALTALTVAVGLLGDAQAIAAMIAWLDHGWADIVAFAATPGFRWVLGLLPPAAILGSALLMMRHDSKLSRKRAEEGVLTSMAFKDALAGPVSITRAYMAERRLTDATAALANARGHLREFDQALATATAGAFEYQVQFRSRVVPYDTLLHYIGQAAALSGYQGTELEAVRNPQPHTTRPEPVGPQFVHRARFDPALNENYLAQVEADRVLLEREIGRIEARLRQNRTDLDRTFRELTEKYG